MFPTKAATDSPNSPLPLELWSAILTLATPFHNFDPPPIGHGTSQIFSEWKASLRFRKGILLVCQAWRNANTHLLFEHIVITEIPQLARIVQLVEGDDTPGWWTKTIVLQCAIMRHWHAFYNQHTARLLRCCPNLHRFIDRVVDGAIGFGVFRELSDLIHSSLLAGPFRVPLQLLDLTGDDMLPANLLKELAPNLKSLSILGLYHVGENPSAFLKISLPVLTHLMVVQSGLPEEDSSAICIAPLSQNEWVTPSLQSLSIRSLTGRSPFLGSFEYEFIRLKGPNILFLDLLGSEEAFGRPFHLHNVLRDCPNLQHLAFAVDHIITSDPDDECIQPHPALVRVTVSEGRPFHAMDQRVLHAFESPITFPSLQCITMVSVRRCDTLWPEDADEADISPPNTTLWYRIEHKQWNCWKRLIDAWGGRGVRLENAHGDLIRLQDFFTEWWDHPTDSEPVWEEREPGSYSESEEEDGEEMDTGEESDSSSGERGQPFEGETSSGAGEVQEDGSADLEAGSESEMDTLEEPLEDINEQTALEIYAREIQRNRAHLAPSPEPFWSPTIYFVADARPTETLI